eukprot:1149341-Rhodomonas_salina.3
MIALSATHYRTRVARRSLSGAASGPLPVSASSLSGCAAQPQAEGKVIAVTVFAGLRVSGYREIPR